MATKKREALGAGLNALFGDESSEINVSSTETLPISKIEPRKEQPREYFDEEALQILADSISQYGVIQPITVRKLENGIYQIIAGERRWRASRLAGLKEIPVRIIEADDKTTAQMALVENLQREDLNPVEEAKGYKKLMDEYGMTQEQTSKAVGKSRPAITNSLRLLSLCPEVLEMVEKEELSAGHARTLVTIEDKEKQLSTAKEIVEKGYSVRKAETLASSITNKKNDEKNNKTEKDKIDYANEIAEELSKILSRKVVLTENMKIGKISLEYYGKEDRENLIEKLKKL